jgi:hypothetical protein
LGEHGELYPFTYKALSPTTGGFNARGGALPGAWAVGNEESEVADTVAYMYAGSYPAVRAPSIPAPGIGIVASPGGAPQFAGQNILLHAGATYTAVVPIVST